jgi:hypothetical protein
MDAELRKRFDRKPQTIIGMVTILSQREQATARNRGVGRDLIQRD